MKALVAADHKEEILKRGFERAGFKIVRDIPQPEKSDVLCVWNRRGQDENLIRRFESAGARVVVAENGYIGCDLQQKKLIALAIGGHAGTGQWPVKEEPRFFKQGIAIKPWRAPGNAVMILAQRGIGNSKKLEWAKSLAADLKVITKRPIIIRPHPGKDAKESVEAVLADVWAVVTWSSAAAIRAIAFGTPAFYFMPGWIGAPAAKFGIEELENPYRGDRCKMFQQIGWAQWTQDEIAGGLAIRHLLNLEEKPT